MILRVLTHNADVQERPGSWVPWKSRWATVKCVYSRYFAEEILWRKELTVTDRFWRLWSDDTGQDIAEYAVMLAVILVLVVGTIRLIGSNANTVFSSAASSIQ